jgi:adenylate cyclase
MTGGTVDPERLRELGLYDPEAEDAEQRLQLIEAVVGMGATEEELVEWGGASERLGPLALELAMRTGRERVPFTTAVADAGLSLDEAARLWRALGFPDPRESGSEPQLSPEAVEALRLMTGMGRELFGPEGTLALARVMGGTSARLAQALVDAFRTEIELPLQSSGATYAEIVASFTRLAREDLPRAFAAFAVITRQHLVAQASGTWSSVADEAVAHRDLVIGFADLVGYTTLSRGLSGSALAALIRRFEELLGEAVSAGRGRVVKLIGDGAMFVSEDAGAACEIGLELCAAFDAADDVPPVRVGLAAGSVVAAQGDYYGAVVNVAARLVAIAEPSTVAADEEVRARATGRFEFRRLPERSLKGVPDAPAYIVEAR